jgi:aryl-alcohol dehydrogenase-like predicted oxidoreductase
MRNDDRKNQDNRELGRREFIKKASLGAASIGILAGELSCSGLNIFGKNGGKHQAASQMRYRRLGRTEVMVSEIGLGGHYNGPKWEEKKSKEQWQREAVFKECLKNGINLFDTNTEYERESLGKLLGSIPDLREKIYIVTDINDLKQSGPDTYDYMMEIIDVQLSTLQLPSVDILRFTTVIKKTPSERLEAAFKAFQKMKKDGKVKYLAVSQHDPELLTKWVNKYDEIDIIYTPYNYFAPRAEDELFNTARKKDMGIVIIKPFNKGTIFNPELSKLIVGSGSRSILERVEKEKEQRTTECLIHGTDLTLAQASLRFILANESVTTVIPGMETVEEVKENVSIVDSKFGDLDRSLLERYASIIPDALPSNYRWLKHWCHA